MEQQPSNMDTSQPAPQQQQQQQDGKGYVTSQAQSSAATGPPGGVSSEPRTSLPNVRTVPSNMGGNATSGPAAVSESGFCSSERAKRVSENAVLHVDVM